MISLFFEIHNVFKNGWNVGNVFRLLDKIFSIYRETGSHGVWFWEQTRDRPVSLCDIGIMIKKEYVEFISFSVNKSNDFGIDLKEFPTNPIPS